MKDKELAEDWEEIKDKIDQYFEEEDVIKRRGLIGETDKRRSVKGTMKIARKLFK